MKRTNALTAISDTLSGFQTELQRLALQIVEDVIRREAQHHQARSATKRKPGRPAKAPARAQQPVVRRGRGRPSKAQQQLDLLAAADAAVPAAVASSSTSSVAAAPSSDPPPPPPSSAVFSGKRRQWTRESITEELANWLVSGNSTDASFVTRHGPPGLAAAARRVFGRFDAALNVAGLHVAKLYPDGPPPKRGASSMKMPRGPRPKQPSNPQASADQGSQSEQQATE